MPSEMWDELTYSFSNFNYEISLKFVLKGTFTHAWSGAGGKLASVQIITCIHTYAVAERRRSRIKICSTTNGSNTLFSTSASKPHAPNHLCPQQMTDPPVSAHICEHTLGRGDGMSKSIRLRSATTPRMCEHKSRVHSTIFQHWFR